MDLEKSALGKTYKEKLNTIFSLYTAYITLYEKQWPKNIETKLRKGTKDPM